MFLIFQAYFQSKDFFLLESAATQAGATTDEWKQFVAYVALFYCNMSNYNSFGKNKFVPECSQDAFKSILLSNPLYTHKDSSLYKSIFDELYP